MNKIKSMINRTSLKLKKHSPEILIFVGIGGTIVSTVMACRASTKIGDILDDTKENLDLIRDNVGNPDLIEEYTEEDSKKDLFIVYAKTSAEIVKLYAPAVVLGTLSVTSILASNNILKKRNVALAAAYATIDKGFKEYRSRVIERFGETVDHEIRHNIKSEKIEETVIDENGKKKKVKTTISVADPNALSDYAKYFNASNPNWDESPEYTEFFLTSQQNYANDLLRANKMLTLNEVYRSLGMQETKAGMVVGWVYDAKEPIGDNYVDFRIKKVHLRSENGVDYERAYSLDFNVDGNIFDKM